MVAAPEQPVEDPELQEVNWRAVEGFAIFVIAIIVTFVVTVPLSILLRPISNCGSLDTQAAQTCFNHRDLLMALLIGVNEAALLLTVLLWVRWVHKKPPRALGFKSLTPANAGLGVLIGLGGLFVAGIISAALTSVVQNVTHRTVEAPKQISLQQNPSHLALVIVGLSVIVLAPLAEEAFFRGFVFRGLLKWLRPGWAIVLSAAIFGVLHFIPLIMLPIFGLGVLLASIVRARKSLVPSIFAHATFNAVGFVELFIHRH